jgi:hypothetical protein
MRCHPNMDKVSVSLLTRLRQGQFGNCASIGYLIVFGPKISHSSILFLSLGLAKTFFFLLSHDKNPFHVLSCYPKLVQVNFRLNLFFFSHEVHPSLPFFLTINPFQDLLPQVVRINPRFLQDHGEV